MNGFRHTLINSIKVTIMATIDYIVSFLTTTANHENPELIWNDDARTKVSKMAKEMKDRWKVF